MRVVREQHVGRFFERVGPHLGARPAENNLMVGLLGDYARAGGVAGRETAPDHVAPLLFAIEDGGVIQGVAMQTPPRALIVSRASEEAIDALVDFLLAADVPIPGVTGPAITAERFARRWEARTGRAAIVRMAQTVYELVRVRPPASPRGAMREAVPGDEQLLAAWSDAFHREAGADPVGDHLAFVRGKMASRQLFLWENGAPVSMAAWVGRTSFGVRVGYVYTPAAERRKGYASALVGALSQRLLDQGSPRCFLFANTANATANKIYLALGYEPASDFRLYQFSGV